MSDDKSDETDFLNRWSRKKAQARTAIAPEDGAVVQLEEADAATEHEIVALESDASGGDGNGGTETTAESGTSADEIPPEIADIDIESMTYDSDFTVFMKDNVPEIIRRRALRQLWRSDPILANVDGLNDYDEDFTDAAMVVKGLKSAYQVGKGYLTAEDEEEVEGAEDKAAGEGEEGTEATETADAEADSSESEDTVSDEEQVLDENTEDSDVVSNAETGDDSDTSSDETDSDTTVEAIMGDPIRET